MDIEEDKITLLLWFRGPTTSTFGKGNVILIILNIMSLCVTLLVLKNMLYIICSLLNNLIF